MDENHFKDTKKYILDLIANNNYPKGHPFLAETFSNDFILKILVLLKIILPEDNIIEDYITGKFKAHNQGVFAIDKYYQVLSEVTFLWYLISGLMKNDKEDFIRSFSYEPESQAKKKFEYSFKEPISNIKINFEVKTITCDPFLKETDKNFKIGEKFIKSYFGDTLEELGVEPSEEYTFLSKSTQYKQIRSALKKIAEKFVRSDGEVNIGVVVCQFATSWEEFLSYFMNPQKGYIFKNSNIFQNYDAIVFFSMTATPDIYMNDIYTSHNTFTILTSNNIKQETLEFFRLDNVYANNGKIWTEIIPYCDETFGKYVLEARHGILSFFREDYSEKEKEQYCSELSQKINKK